MSLLTGGLLIVGDMPTPTPTPTPIVTPNNVRGQLVARLPLVGDFQAGINVDTWVILGGSPYWIRFAHANYLGTHGSDPMIISGTHQAGHFYYRTSDNQWRGIFEDQGSLSWDNWSLRSALGSTMVRDQYAYASEALANAGLPDPRDPTHTYYAFFDSHYWVYQGDRLFENTVYVLPDGEALKIAEHEVSPTHLGWFLAFTGGDGFKKSFFLPISNDTGVSDWFFAFLGATVFISSYTQRLTFQIDSDMTLLATDNYQLEVYLAEN